jgi:hypothetical protein
VYLEVVLLLVFHHQHHGSEHEFDIPVLPPIIQYVLGTYWSTTQWHQTVANAFETFWLDSYMAKIVVNLLHIENLTRATSIRSRAHARVRKGCRGGGGGGAGSGSLCWFPAGAATTSVSR